VGPIGPGEHALGYAYRVPSSTDGVELDMRFPREVTTLNVLIADSGLALDSQRLHRRRPFRNGTRNYLHREAFNISPDEVVDLEIEPLSGTGLPQQASVALVVAGAAAAGLFLMAPLRRTSTPEAPDDAALVALRDEREAVYASIADLDHDFETGKLDEADYHEMRDAQRARAIELLRHEQAGTGATSAPSSDAPLPAQDEANAAGEAPQATAAAGTAHRFCSNCGGQIDARWRFCSHCGGALDPGAGEDVRG